MELCIVNGVSCVKRKVENIDVYYNLAKHTINGVSPIMKIEGDYVYYQFINGMSLREILNEGSFYSKFNLTRFIYDLTNILECLRKINIVHKDLKPENIIISYDGVVHLIDFDVSRVYTQKECDTKLLGTRGYASPEHYGYQITTFKSDMYSLGRIIEELDIYFKYSKIASICTQMDPENRYNSYLELINDLDGKELNLKYQTNSESDKEKTSNEDNSKVQKKNIKSVILSSYSKKVIIIYTVLLLFIFFGTSDLSNMLLSEMYLSFLVSYMVIDLIDFIRIVLVRRSYFKYKFFISIFTLGMFLVIYLFCTILYEAFI